MIAEGRVTEGTVVRIRTPRAGWGVLLVSSAVWFLSSWIPSSSGSWNPFPALVSVVFLGEALWLRTCGIDLTPEFANVRGIRRRRVPWGQVQAVLAYRQWGVERVALVLDSGERVVLRVPSTYWLSGATTAAKYREEFHSLGQWWLAHRGSSWHPVRPEAPDSVRHFPKAENLRGDQIRGNRPAT